MAFCEETQAITVDSTDLVYYAACLARVEREQKTAAKDARFGAHFTQRYRFFISKHFGRSMLANKYETRF
jgi:hypothetical protein